MKAYHGTNRNFKKLDVNKTSEYGLYFGIKREVAESYGVNVHKVELSYKKLCDLTSPEGIEKAINLLPELRIILEEEGGLDEDSNIADELDNCLSILGDSSVNLENGKSLRDELLKQINASGYDSVLIQDYTDGDEHKAYVIFNNANYQYI